VTDTTLIQFLLNSGIAGLVLVLIIVRLEQRLRALEQAISRLTVVLLVSAKNHDKRIREVERWFQQEIEAMEGKGEQ
jgi:tryptophan synthase alpha subunit